MTSIIMVSIDGNIGSGKTTLLKKLRKHYSKMPRVIFADEPVNDWSEIKDHDGVSIIEKFYNDQHTYSFSFQMMAYISRLAILRKIKKNNQNNENIIIITERSLYTDKYVFAKMLYDQGKIKSVDYQIYLRWFYEFADDFPVHHCVYLRADPSTCATRIQQRSRQGEDAIPLSYLQMCHEYHEEFLTNTTVNTLRLDGNENIIQRPEVVQEWIEQIDQLIVVGSRPHATDEV